jgi:2-polyprenyl-3-methyl-5-hydroxy-6-metoxy-1,4-benzoquinol methylase
LTTAGEEYHVYDYQVDLGGDSAPARVINLVEPNCKVLEIGAGPGSITRHLSGVKQCDVVALEVDESAIRKLKPHARRIMAADLNVANWAEQLADEAPFDYVIAADVLEHVLDPLAVLKGMRSLLGPKGSVILSLPHVGHHAIIACLMDEDFGYRDWGLLDRTHIRFFGVKNIENLYADAGLAIAEAQFVVRHPIETEFADKWQKLSPELQSALSANPYGNVYQVVSRAMAVANVATPIKLMGMPVENRGQQTAALVAMGPARAWARKNLSPERRRKLLNLARRIGLKI